MNISHRAFVGVALVSIAGVAWWAVSSFAQDTSKSAATTAKPAQAEVTVDPNGTVHLPPMAVPFSEFASREAKAAFLQLHETLNQKDLEPAKTDGITEQARARA